MFSKDVSILIVDDVKTMRVFIIKKLKSLGFSNFEEAENGKEAYEKIKTGKFQLVFSDINMPEMSGLECLRNIRSNANFKDLPFILITAEIEDKTKKEAENALASGYLVKPFSDDDLVLELERISRGGAKLTKGTLVNKDKEKVEMKKVDDAVFMDTILEGIKDALSNQCGLKLKVGMTQRVSSGKAWGIQSSNQITSVSYLVSGNKEFSLILYFDEDVYVAYAMKMFNEEFSSIKEVGDDIVAEWLNIALGSIKKVCNDDFGYNFSNNIPQLIKGTQIVVGSKEKSLLVCPFESAVGTFHLILSMGAEKIIPWNNG